MSVANKMRVYGEAMTDVTICEKILRSLTEKFNYIVCSIEESRDIDALTIDELQSSLIVHEQKFHRSSSVEQALKVKTDGRVGGRGRGRNNYRGRGRGRGEVNEEDEMLLMSYVESHEVKRNDAWFLDSGCSNHMCGNRDLEWGENEENNEGEERVSDNGDENGNGDRRDRSGSEGSEEARGREVGNPNESSENEGIVGENEGRVRRPPPYLNDYVSGEGSVKQLLLWWMGTKVDKKIQMVWDVISFAFFWTIWKVRNDSIFNSKQPMWNVMFELIRSKIVLWVKFKMDLRDIRPYGLFPSSIIPID
ncbi:hypothetical protein F0562_032801 [Nyssa sinensis]|uniref:Uncharacterized protein n=1 Tax=Nyssa sinensis TaxID=561372 RepID=A0A5J5ARA1_9ASTE|nr:hypothetical protein F0562_032801 [Nyssa sinensis]